MALRSGNQKQGDSMQLEGHKTEAMELFLKKSMLESTRERRGECSWAGICQQSYKTHPPLFLCEQLLKCFFSCSKVGCKNKALLTRCKLPVDMGFHGNCQGQEEPTAYLRQILLKPFKKKVWEIILHFYTFLKKRLRDNSTFLHFR